MKNYPGIIRATGTALATALIAFSTTAFALSPPPPQADDELLPLLYETLGGENWHNNEGWLDPEVHWCDWHGVVCGEEFWPGYFEFYALDLADNNLTGEITPRLAELLASSVAPEMRLDLSDNAIEGTLHKLPHFTRRVRLGNNRFDNELPTIEADAVTQGLEFLRLNNNAFEGEVPSSWEDLSLIQLDLSNNALDGSVSAAVEALDPAEASLLDLSDNAFSGELPAWITELPLDSRFGVVGSVNICWTGLTVGDEATREWLAERHVGGPDFDSCMNRERRTVGPEVSGSWFDPTRDGEGYSLMLLEDGTPLIYWFTHISASRQMWLVGAGRHEDTTLFFDELLRTEGRFGQGYGDVSDPIERKGEQRMDGVADGQLHLSAHINYWLGEVAQPDDGPIIHAPNPLDFRADLARLSELAGTTCDNQSEFQQYSGAWYNPERAGEGFIVEVLPDDGAVVYWFTHQPDETGDQAWMIGQGSIAAGTETCLAPGCEPPDAVIEIEQMNLPIDAGQSFPASTTGVENLDWGELTLIFGSEGNGSVWFDSRLEGCGSNQYPIKRLAKPMLAECPEGDSQ
ncbi:hypothetical protein [Wenzhouxiangella sp. EGI_FJ10305]|uniref:hypothetical protein n=1 Tax=Wenzhouxiangella sp. EGI_FJ10305 TaxID=3243768 RepID=UPI0035D872B8